MVLIGKPLMHCVCALAEGAIRAVVIIKPPVANSEIQGFVAAMVMGNLRTKWMPWQWGAALNEA